MKPALDALIEETPREIFNRSKDFGAFALATGGDLRLPPGHGAPTWNSRSPTAQSWPHLQTGSAPGDALAALDNRRPLLRQPGEALGRIEMHPTQTGPFEMKIPSCVTRYRHTGGCRAHRTRARSAPGCRPSSNTRSPSPPPAAPPRSALPSVSSAWGSVRSAPAAMAGDQAVHAMQQQGLLPAIETSWAEAPALTQHRHGHVVHKEVDQHRSPPQLKRTSSH